MATHDDDSRARVLSGIRATGELHIGNYYGALRFFAELARDPSLLCMFFVANLHSLTTRTDPGAMNRDLREIIRWYLAAGIDPEQHIIFVQSSVPATTNLSWLLACMTGAGELQRMPHWKEKSASQEGVGEGPNAGLLTYPILMAADILGPGANIVPVGEDQKPHVELAQVLARRFNQRVKEPLFPIPSMMDQPVRVPGLRGDGKMGKSERQGTISLTDGPDLIRRKCQKAEKKMVANPADKEPPIEPRLEGLPGNPDKCRVHQLHVISNKENAADIAAGCSAGTLSCGDCKHRLADRIISELAPLQSRHAEVAARGDAYIDQILHDGGQRAHDLINPRVARAMELMGVPKY